MVYRGTTFCSRIQARCTMWACRRHCSLRSRHILEERRECCRETDPRGEAIGQPGLANVWNPNSFGLRFRFLQASRIGIDIVVLACSFFSKTSLLEIFLYRELERERIELSLLQSSNVCYSFWFYPDIYPLEFEDENISFT